MKNRDNNMKQITTHHGRAVDSQLLRPVRPQHCAANEMKGHVTNQHHHPWSTETIFQWGAGSTMVIQK